jgi:hypothetical protein
MDDHRPTSSGRADVAELETGNARRERRRRAATNPGKLDPWLVDALGTRIHCMRQFAIKLRQDAAAVRNAITEVWSNGQVEGQINRLKTLKRAMCGRAGHRPAASQDVVTEATQRTHRLRKTHRDRAGS